MAGKNLLKLSFSTNYDGDRDTANLKILDKPMHCCGTDTFLEVVRRLACSPSGNPCDFPSADFVVDEEGKWKIFVHPASMWAGEDNSSVEFACREFSRIPIEEFPFRTMISVREWKEKLKS